ncbi:Serine/threonine-protein kinase [Cladophialophora chaetospira]|uniref:non-specific serine/threonine protein kinase n=1 Tax=Cladophialophora chaetospira TaxID=386627 RepID=A0AA38X4N4_9EURO|nr:Serine/threonine-protein kinase [Cladophialophora chaetospira]
MDHDNNRLRLNFQFDNQQNFDAANARMYPTTPSTFPQPIYGTQQHEYGGGALSPNPAANAGYFLNQQYPPQSQQPQYQQQYAYQGQPGLQSPQPAYQANSRPYMANTNNDGTSGLIQQFSNQDLGATPRGNVNRTPSPAMPRPRTAGESRQAQNPYQGHLAPPVPRPSPKPEEEEQPNPRRYTDNVVKRGTAAKQLVNSFFQENIERARDRNSRAKELEAVLKNPNISDLDKQREINTLAQKEARFLRFIRTREVPSNFSTIKVIGKGAFGEVKLVQRKTDGKIYALKSLIKSEMFKKDQLAHVRAERDILADSKDNPWLVKLHASFQDNTYLYMLMEFLPGGDLMTMLIKYEIFSEDITRFYMAEIVMAIEAVHKLGFLHRDIKPDNILLDRGGHIKLTDFGLSTGGRKQHENSYYQALLKAGTDSKSGNRNSMALNEQINLTVSNRGLVNTWRKSRRHMAYSTVGTPDYIAPEIFLGQGYTYLCDWWSVGAIMFECLVGWPPFCAEDTHDTYRKIVNWRESLYFPDELVLGREAEDMIRSFLCDANDRLGKEGGAHDGASQIKKHPFFRGVVWDQLRKIRAPFEPKLSSNIDVSYFPIDEIPQEDNSAVHRAHAKQISPEQDAEMSLPFIGYTYKAFTAFQNS